MPYVDSLIPCESHKEDCPNPLARRLYIRDYDKNGKQRFVPYGVTCTKCGIILKQKYEHNLTDKQKEQDLLDKRYGSALDEIFGPKPPKDVIERNLDKCAKNEKIAKRKAKERKTKRKISEVINRQLERAYIARHNYRKAQGLPTTIDYEQVET